MGISFGLILALSRGLNEDRPRGTWRHLTKKENIWTQDSYDMRRRYRWTYVSGTVISRGFKSRGCRVVVVTDKRAVKYTDGYDDLNVNVISSSTLPSGLLGKVKGLFLLAYGYFQSNRLVNKYAPNLVIGFGGLSIITRQWLLHNAVTL